MMPDTGRRIFARAASAAGIRFSGQAWLTVLAAVVMLLVPLLAWLQYQWLGQVSEAERERMQRTLETSAAQFAREARRENDLRIIPLIRRDAEVRHLRGTATEAVRGFNVPACKQSRGLV